jgi:hypothetical protein
MKRTAETIVRDMAVYRSSVTAQCTGWILIMGCCSNNNNNNNNNNMQGNRGKIRHQTLL